MEWLVYFLCSIPNPPKVTNITKLFSILPYFLDEYGNGKGNHENNKLPQMIYKLTPKKSQDVKTLIEANTKKAAICYFAALLHLTEEDLLKIFSIR